MKKRNKGFTLIELLVVVLIIGILAAVAVPQYQKIVVKSQALEIINLVSTIGRAQELYYTQHGHYADASEAEELDISLPAGIENKYKISYPDLPGMVLIQIKNGRYASAGFEYVIKKGLSCFISCRTSSAMSQNNILCVEPYWADSGRYCTNMFGGKYIDNKGKRYFIVPNFQKH